jgi:hypothetical protein
VKAKAPDTRLRGALVMALCCGLSFYLTTGEAVKALAVTLAVGCVVALLVVIFPPGRKWRRAEDFYLAGVIFLVLPWVLAKIGYPGRSGRDRPAWHDLHARYAATGSAPGGLEDGRDIVVSRVRSFWIKRYSYKHVATSFNDRGAYLSHTFPLSMLYGPVEIPVNSIWRCRKEPSEPGSTTLSVRDLEMEIRLPDEAWRILGWCERHEIPDGFEPAP